MLRKDGEFRAEIWITDLNTRDEVRYQLDRNIRSDTPSFVPHTCTYYTCRLANIILIDVEKWLKYNSQTLLKGIFHAVYSPLYCKSFPNKSITFDITPVAVSMDRHKPKWNTYFTYRPVSIYSTGHLAYNTVGINYDNFVCCTPDIRMCHMLYRSGNFKSFLPTVLSSHNCITRSTGYKPNADYLKSFHAFKTVQGTSVIKVLGFSLFD